MKNEINNFLYKSIGFANYNHKLSKNLINDGYKLINQSQESLKFLRNSYNTEYLKIMFSNANKNGIKKFAKELNHKITITLKYLEVNVNRIELFMFFNKFEKNQTCLYSIDYSIENQNLNKISDLTHSLKFHETEISFNSVSMKLIDFITNEILYNKCFTKNNENLEQFSGSKFKNYLIIDFNEKIDGIDDLLFELGTTSKIGTIKENGLYAPSSSYKNKTLENIISCFNNYKCLSLLDSFTVIGENNYDKENIYSKKIWDDIYFSIYIFNLYVKCSVQILSNHFSANPMKKRKEFQNFYNKYYLKKISFNFLPNEIYKGIRKSMEIEDDIDFINQRLETAAIQINEKQQRQQEMLLLAISVIALLETPLHIDGIRQIIGINQIEIYNIATYSSLVFLVSLFLILKLGKKY